jgi:tetratricopeptide (TPR) repeat protein
MLVSRTSRRTLAVWIALALAWPLFAWTAEEAEGARIDFARAVRVEDLKLETGAGFLHIADGTLFPSTSAGDRIVEIVLLGEATIHFTPPDDVEATQLELFTGQSELEEQVDEAVLVVCNDDAAKLLMDRPVVGETTEDVRTRVTELYREWIEGPGRRQLNVEEALLLDSIGDPRYEGYFAARLHNEELGTFILVVDPVEREQVTLGQFVAADTTEKEEKKIRKYLHRQQRRGKLMGVVLEDFGTWDTWVSTTLRDDAGEPSFGAAAFEPLKYTLDVTIGDSGKDITASARIDLEPRQSDVRFVRLMLHQDLVVDAVLGPDGAELQFGRNGSMLDVTLPDAPDGEAQTHVEVRYHGVMLEKVGSKVFSLRDTFYWYPHVGLEDRATYEVMLRYPRRFDLMASGKKVEEGEDAEARQKWERRWLGVPSMAFSFEIGDYEVRRIAAGKVAVTVAFDRFGDDALAEIHDEVLDTIRSSMQYYEKTFGPYPLDYLTVVTVPRLDSQGFLGFVTLSDLLMEDLGMLGLLLGFEDRRTVIAHEIAHQWWGNLVGWKSYRDQWLSEAMANYAAMIWARDRLPEDEQPRIGPTTGWQDQLTDVTDEGHAIESLGPLVLGGRLESSLSSGAYSAIVYKKGAVILNMLGKAYGDENFLKMLHELVRVASHKLIDSRDFITILEKTSGSELQWFADQYIFNTGLPEVYYDYEFTAAEDGKWKVSGSAKQQTPYRYTYSVERLSDGRLDVRRATVDQMDVSDSALTVPVRIAVYNPIGKRPASDKKKGKKGGSSAREPVSNASIDGRMMIRGKQHDFEFEVGYQPMEMWFDPKREVFGRFFSENDIPKRVMYYKGLDAVAAGNLEEGAEFFRRALEESAKGIDSPSVVADAINERRERSLDVRIRAQLAWLHMDRGDIDQAAQHLELLRKERKRAYFMADSYLRIGEGRLKLLQGDAEGAYARLSKNNRKRIWFVRPSGYALLAIAAKQTGNDKVYDAAMKKARRRGIDVKLLEEGS